MKTTLLYAQYTNTLSYYDDWIDAFRNAPQLTFDIINVADPKERDRETLHRIENAELIILHHSLMGDTLSFIKPIIPALKNRKGKLVSFVGNEVNLPILGLKPRLTLLKELEPEIIATQLLLEAGEWLYADCKASKALSIPHALNPHAFKGPKNFHDRGTDIGTRSHKYGAMIGDNDRNSIIEKIESLSTEFIVDTGNQAHAQKRFNRQEWSMFLGNCKATTSTEAGSFYLERDDALITNIEAYLRKKSGKIVLPRDNKAREIYRNLIPPQLRSLLRRKWGQNLTEAHELDQDDNFEEVWHLFFKDTPRCPVYSKAISSRHFDAVGTRTLQILFPGRYNDILRPHEHYFELQRDGANIEDLKRLLRNPVAWKTMVDSTYDYVIHNHTHAHRVSYLLSHLGF